LVLWQSQVKNANLNKVNRVNKVNTPDTVITENSLHNLNTLNTLNTLYTLYSVVKIPGKEIIPGIEFEKEFKKCPCLDLLNIDEFIQSVIIKKSLLQKPNSMQEQIIYNYPFWAIRELIFNAISPQL
jgi:hypothetical protein